MTIKIDKLKKIKMGDLVTLNVWISKFRKLGNLLFIIGQDSSGFVQLIIKEKKLIEELKIRKRGDLIKFKGKLKKIFNSESEVEIEVISYKILNQTKDLPFEIKNDVNINEDTRYRYRYLDLRIPRSKNLLIKKSHFIHELRNFLYKKGFVDIETPILSQDSPEGAKCFLVPFKLRSEERYYTLSQSPQIFKQLLMIGGFDKYYQIAKSFRNEDARSNRQIEFSQLDLEMSFVDVKKIKKTVEDLLKCTIKKVFNIEVKTPFPSISYKESIEKYKTDRPNINSSEKKELNFLWINDWKMFKYCNDKKKYDSLRHPFTAPKKKYIEKILSDKKISLENVTGDAFDLICNGEEILSGSIRIHKRELQEKILSLLGYNSEEKEEFFGYFLKALDFAAPPHGGVGIGIDRILSIIMKTVNLKELIAFPKNIDGTCSLTGAPNKLRD